MSTILPAELDDQLDGNSKPYLLDIRPRTNYREGAIESSHNVPVYDELAGGDDSALLDRIDSLPKDREIVVICKMGIVAKQATQLLEEEGYDARTLAGGMSGWRGYRHGSIGYRLRSFVWKLRQ